MAQVDIALACGELGVEVFPVQLVEQDNGKSLKKPLIKWSEGASDDEAQIRRWWRQWPDAVVGVPTGKRNDLYVLDLDPGGSLDDLPFSVQGVPSNPTRREGGRHWYWSGPRDGKPVRNSAIAGLDVRGDGGFVVMWYPPHPGPLPALPPLAAEWARERGGGSGTGPAGEVPEVLPEGERESRLVSLAGSMRRRGMDQDEILAALRVANEKRCVPPLSDEDVERIAGSVMRYEPAGVPKGGALLNAVLAGRQNTKQRAAISDEDELTQHDIAVITAQALAGRAVWRTDRDEWWMCSQTTRPGIWSQERTEAVQAIVDEIVVTAKPKASESFASGVGRFLRRKLPIDPSEFDRHPWLLGVQGGVIDLRSGELLPADPALYLTRAAPTEYDLDASCPTWLAHLDRLFEGDSERVAWFQRAIGASLVGSAKEKDQLFVYLIGPPGNGKGTTMRALINVLGQDQHAANLQAADLVRERHLAWMHRLRNVRLAVVEEVKDARMDGGKLKALTGGDTIVANRMRQEDENWQPTHMLFMTANHPPKLDDAAGILRRYRPIQTASSIPLNELQPGKYEAALEAEYPGILTWAVQGCLAWQADGQKLAVMEQSLELAVQHLEDNDPFLEWAEEAVRFVDDGYASRKQIVSSYNWWRAQRALPNMRATEHANLFEWLRERGAIEKRRTGSERGFTGIAVVAGPLCK